MSANSAVNIATRCNITAERQAYPGDVRKSGLSPSERLAWTVLCDHVNHSKPPYTGRVNLKDETFAEEMGGVGKRTIQRLRSSLREKHWLCLPEGDAGGRGNATIHYHLHPDGKPCGSFCVELKQNKKRPDVAEANRTRAVVRKQKDDNLSSFEAPPSEMYSTPKDDNAVILSCLSNHTKSMTNPSIKHDNLAIKHDKPGHAYKEEPSLGTISLEPSTPTPHAREGTGAADDSLIGKLQSPETEQEFRRLNALLKGPGLNGQGRLRIAKAAAKYGFSLASLAHAFGKHSGGLNQAGGLLRFAEAWPVSTAGISDWPSCGKCLDEGFTAGGGCSCDAGVRWLKKHPSEAARLQAKREGKRFCEMCDNTGIDKFFDLECKACRNGREVPVISADGVPEL